MPLNYIRIFILDNDSITNRSNDMANVIHDNLKLLKFIKEKNRWSLTNLATTYSKLRYVSYTLGTTNNLLVVTCIFY